MSILVILKISVYFDHFRYLKGIWVILEVSRYIGYFRDFESIFGHFRGFECILVILEIWGNCVILQVSIVFWSF